MSEDALDAPRTYLKCQGLWDDNDGDDGDCPDDDDNDDEEEYFTRMLGCLEDVR